MNCNKDEEESTFLVDSDYDPPPDYVNAVENGSDINATSMTHCFESNLCSQPDPCYFDYKYYIDGIVLFIVAIFGITGTLMSIAVLFKPQLQNPFTKLLRFLCIFDCTFLIMAIFYISLPSISCW